MRLSVLDFFFEPADTLEFVQQADSLGYERYWVGEHHTPYQCANPLMFSLALAGITNDIRVGPGAVGLAPKSPFLVAEDARLANWLFPGRIDLGVTPGGVGLGGALADAVWDHRDPTTAPDYVTKVRDLHGCLTGRLAPDHPLRNHLYLQSGPPMWLLGMSSHSATLAGQLGVGFCTSFHHGGTVDSVHRAIATYRQAFTVSPEFQSPQAIVVLGGVSSFSEERRQAAWRAARALPSVGSREIPPTVFFDGRTDECVAMARALSTRVGADELMLISMADRQSEITRAMLTEWAAHWPLAPRTLETSATPAR